MYIAREGSPSYLPEPFHSKSTSFCLYGELDKWLGEHGPPLGFPARLPINESRFAAALSAYLHANPAARDFVGFADESLSAVGWVQVTLSAKFAHHGAKAIEYALDPQALARFEAEWDGWFERLPEYVRWADGGGWDWGMEGGGSYGGGAALGAGDEAEDWVSHEAEGAQEEAREKERWGEWPEGPGGQPGEEHSVLHHGWHDCAKWEILATERAFLGTVFRSCIATPAFTMLATLPVLRNLATCYALLLTLFAMVVAVLGLLRLLGIPLGAVEALAFGLVIGVSADYAIHLAYAYVNTMSVARFHKSQSAVYARARSIGASAATTLLAVAPMLLARMRPMRQVGVVVLLVVLVSVLLSASFFLALLMVMGPRTTRSRARGGGMDAAWGGGGRGRGERGRGEGGGGGGEGDQPGEMPEEEEEEEEEREVVGGPVAGLAGRTHGVGWGLLVDVSDMMDHDQQGDVRSGSRLPAIALPHEVEMRGEALGSFDRSDPELRGTSVETSTSTRRGRREGERLDEHECETPPKSAPPGGAGLSGGRRQMRGSRAVADDAADEDGLL